jgi:type I restriction enzyme S subunit
MDAGFYSEDTRRALFLIQNYSGGYTPIDELGFQIGRGQNLQVTSIGKSIYSLTPRKNFYRLAAPTDLSEFRTSRRFRYLGNPRALSVLKKGDIVFGAEGFGKGRTLIVVDDVFRTITNIHGMIFSHQGGNTTLSTFVGCFLGYLRKIGLVDALAAGGSGGSLAINYLSNVPVPLFPATKNGSDR